MASAPQQPASPSPPPGPASVRDKVRIRFRKGNDLRLLSHHDLMKCFERLLRRAGLRFHTTQGFHPKPRLVFALSLALGIIGCEEVVELELDEALPPEEIHERLARQAPPGLDILSIRRIDFRTTAHVRRACYRIAVPPERSANLPEGIASLLASAECWIERTRGAWRTPPVEGDHAEEPAPAAAHSFNLRPYVRDIRLSSGSLEVDLWVTPNGTARPQEILSVLGLTDLLEAGAVLERSTLELDDEVVREGEIPDLSDREKIHRPPCPAEPGRSEPQAVDRKGQPAALLPGPLSFDS
jgi:hypothetical protein